MTEKLTKEGFNKLTKELEELEIKERPRVAKRLEEAIAQGDLSENAAYEEAKEQQSRMEGRISEIKKILNDAEIIEEGQQRGGVVRIGTTLRAKSPDGTDRIFTITGREESDPAHGKLSYDSPLGRAFMNREKGDEVEIETPSGKRKYAIVEVN
ncbi:MAG: transcription elongation factor GreA [Candidatus Spechtbacteria bacterium]|nr:transcription elongation factor GreA [Candidatus Spechtbacteria bacterium]